MQHMKVGYLRDPIVLPATKEAVSKEKLYVVQDTQLHALQMWGKHEKNSGCQEGLPSYLQNLLQEAMEKRKTKVSKTVKQLKHQGSGAERYVHLESEGYKKQRKRLCREHGE